MTKLPWPISPMLAKPSGALPGDDGRWAFEMKWDGIRLFTRVDGHVTAGGLPETCEEEEGITTARATPKFAGPHRVLVP